MDASFADACIWLLHWYVPQSTLSKPGYLTLPHREGHADTLPLAHKYGMLNTMLLGSKHLAVVHGGRDHICVFWGKQRGGIKRESQPQPRYREIKVV